MSMCKLRLMLVLLGVLGMAAPVAAIAANLAAPTPEVALKPFSAELQDKTGTELTIAAIVNDEVISGFDLDQRVKLVIGASGVQPSPAEMERIRAQVLRSLIDEKLKNQEAKRLKVEVKDQEVVDQLNYIASRNNMTIDAIKKQLKDQGVSIFTLTDQIKTDIAWNELVQGRFGDTIKINPDEVKRIMNEAQTNGDKPQYNVLEIFLGVDSPADDAKVRQQALDLVDQVKHGHPFGQVAESFSQSPSAANGGDIGWVLPGQLPDELDAWLRTAHRGEMTMEPIKTIAGYYLLGIKDTRNVASGPTSAETPLALKRILVRLGAYDSADKARHVKAELDAAAKQINGCENLQKVAASIPGAEIVDLGVKRLADLPPIDANRVVHLVTGQAAGPVERTQEGLDDIVLCGHAEEAQKPGLPTENDIKERLFDQQMSMLSRRYLRDLRRDAVIDSRIAEQ
jgi:peptidyl-prolyl cis-trans isomerase SurA